MTPREVKVVHIANAGTVEAVRRSRGPSREGDIEGVANGGKQRRVTNRAGAERVRTARIHVSPWEVEMKLRHGVQPRHDSSSSAKYILRSWQQRRRTCMTPR
ncbi:hypothetical protein Pan216_26920 [Planctomycetes bacterium Pan216]|uniref:Uncharacterized protein n=1 Tax=Kolteria novifilia TaxID=2527975 RepID=A0A518B4D2_9BACT|nr:hypothetical protein Pan216_26920 [Planctomycetes bacterium Pan216]